MTTKSPSERTDIPPALIEQARALGPSVLAALLASYPTDAAHAEHERRKRHIEKQLSLPCVHRSAA
jgi:hypothetical protein